MSENEQHECPSNHDIAASYQANGFVGPIQVLSRNEAQLAFQEYQQWANSLPDQKVVGDLRFKPHLYLPFVNRIARHPKLVQAVQQVLQTCDILLWSCDFNIKAPQTEMFFPPHQDATYAGLSPSDQCVTAWVALSDPVGNKEGCLAFWKGSHLHGQLPHVEEPSNACNLLSRGQHVANTLEEDACIAIPLRGGEATLHQFYTVHRSGPNHSTQPRVGLALRYMTASVVQTGTVRETVTRISGSLQHECFDLEPVLPLEPTEEDIRIGKEAHADAMRREAANYFDGVDTTAYDESITKD